MRRNTLYAGAVLALAAMGAVMVGSALDLNLESVALLGAAMGAVIALVPERTPLIRLAGFGIGFVIGWAGYVIRAQFMPDTSSGRAVAVGVAVLLCVAVAVATADRITLWTILLGAGAFAGAYEFTYNQSPPELLSTSLSTATTMAFNVAVGFLAGALVAPISGSAPQAPRGRRTPDVPAGDDRVELPEEHSSVLDSFMTETAK
jgi:hypothetical protein